MTKVRTLLLMSAVLVWKIKYETFMKKRTNSKCKCINIVLHTSKVLTDSCTFHRQFCIMIVAPIVHERYWKCIMITILLVIELHLNSFFTIILEISVEYYQNTLSTTHGVLLWTFYFFKVWTLCHLFNFSKHRRNRKWVQFI